MSVDRQRRARLEPQWPLLVASCALALPLCLGASVADARSRSKRKGSAVLEGKLGSARGALRSPDRRHMARVATKGLELDGRLVVAGAIIGPPVWRRDGGAIACVRRAPGRRGVGAGGLQLVVVPLPEASPLLSVATLRSLATPLIWRIPRLVGRRPTLFWMSAQSIGLGDRPLVPRVVISWTTRIARR
ncbi:MAG: hypothetical protein CSB49_03740 [Proteobacteria bacterium]|nr:MAG: hypothetical protein CSB49_03740 [Pseudomonadota bacterium]